MSINLNLPNRPEPKPTRQEPAWLTWLCYGIWAIVACIPLIVILITD